MNNKFFISLICMAFFTTKNAFAMDGGFCFPAKQAERGKTIIASTEIGINMKWICDDEIMERFFYRPAATTSQLYSMGFRIIGVYTIGPSMSKHLQEGTPYILIERYR
ncbi:MULTISPECIES: hypothetical protein [Burkholderiaceae]|uniref:hypothetical protein n=1 Tax=Burkholderiaceae TaxID=119060 RepID=UPI0009605EE8|nr:MULTISPECIES: hypothetical protein [Burkholderiaceae]MCG1018726.1 hypothetical protein [Mycetohabitans sp. B4]MCG1039547.1 hypothetical protein [Mycetohabitans sp. B7]SIT69703.1 hypothetical protein SAMN04487769_1548 [Burkholderia sp. b14]SIT75094.1 hypothetical protein SAMN04487768_3134 [Burkholderia sp. b13]